jgi:hypothetical protein
MGPGSHVGFPISAKNNNLVYDYPMNISAKFAETAEQISTKLARHVHWVVLCQIGVDRKFKMAAMTRLSLTLDPMGISHFHKKIFKISTNPNTLWALAAMLDFRSAPKTKILYMTIQ